MEVSLTGILLITISTIINIKRKIDPLQILCFFIVFTSTGVIKIGSFWISLPFVQTLIVILSYLFSAERRQIVISFILGKSMIWLLLLSISCLLSALMPAIINGDLSVLDVYENQNLFFSELIPVIFKIQYITQTLYFLLGLAITIITIAFIGGDQDRLRLLMKYLMLSFFLMITWSFIETVLYFIGVDFPHMIFNQIGTKKPWTELRLTSVAMEPSILAQYFVSLLPIFITNYWDREIVKDWMRKLGVFFSLIVILFINSYTCYAGLLVVLFFLVAYRMRNTPMRRIILINLVILISAALVVYWQWDLISGKIYSYSGVERFGSIYFGAVYFSRYPLLGIGWGVFPVYDFLICVLTGLGIFGLVPFVKILFPFFVRVVIPSFHSKSSQPIPHSIFVSLITLVIIYQFSGFFYYFQFFWILLGMAISALSINKLANDGL